MTRRASERALDCSRPATAAFWGLFGALLAVAAFALQGTPNLASALRVGSLNPLRAQIERELGPLSVASPTGHDGQIYYLIARDPFSRGPVVAALTEFDTPRYRYRRILFPLLAGGFGQFTPRATLMAMLILAILGIAVSSIAIADLAFSFELSGGAAIVAIVNIGALLSVMLLTVDVMALGLSLGGIALLVRRRVAGALAALALAGLTKETYLVVPAGLAAWQWFQRERSLALAVLLIPLLPFVAWGVWLWYAIPNIPEPGLLGAPLIGMIESLGSWLRPGRLDRVQAVFALYTVASVALAIAMLLFGRQPLLRWTAAAWLLLGCITGEGVWGIPTNGARAFAMLWPIGILLLFGARTSRHSFGSGR